MLRFIAATVLVLHLLFMLFFAASGRSLGISAVIICCLLLLIVYFRKGVFAPAVLTVLVLYGLTLLAVYIALVIGSVQIGKSVNIWLHSFVFLPGVFSASAYIWYVLEDRRTQRATA